jgi:hypothetical protein
VCDVSANLFHEQGFDVLQTNKVLVPNRVMQRAFRMPGCEAPLATWASSRCTVVSSHGLSSSCAIWHDRVKEDGWFRADGSHNSW